MTTTTTTLSATAKAALKADFIAAAKGLITAVCSFTAACKKAVEAGVPIDEIKQWGSEAGLTAQGVNKALREAGIRQRGLRCDVGISKSGNISLALIDGKPSGKKDKEEKEAGEAAKNQDPAFDTKTPEGLAKYVLGLCGGDVQAASRLALGATTILTAQMLPKAA